VQLNNLISEVIVRDSASAVLDRVSAAMDRAADAEGRVQGGADAVTTKITGSTRALETAARQFENLKRAADPVYDRMTQLANQQVQLQRAVSLGVASQSEAAAVYRQLAERANDLSRAHVGLASATKLTYTEMEILKSGAINVFQSLAAGESVARS
jgi:beta-phosphoglucomutase-like phosphatase (HAD superfamily)